VDDIHRKLGNYEELPKEKKQSEYTMEAVEVMEKYNPLSDLKDEEFDEMEDDLDDEFMREYKAKRLKELAETKDQPKFKGIREITRQDYIDEVTNAPKGVYVVLHLYQSAVEVCEVVNPCHV
jgi:Lhr-like helicase